MNRVLMSLCIFLFAEYATAQSEMKIEGSCRGQYLDTAISFKYYSDFDGCENVSQAKVVFTSGQMPNLKGNRSIANGLDIYSFKAKKEGQLETIYWLEFRDSTGNTQGDFKYRDSTGSIKSVLLECKINDYEYYECL